jgi:hypothetical protein
MDTQTQDITTKPIDTEHKEQEDTAASALSTMAAAAEKIEQDEEDDADFEIPLRFTKSGRKRAIPFPLKVSITCFLARLCKHVGPYMPNKWFVKHESAFRRLGGCLVHFLREILLGFLRDNSLIFFCLFVRIAVDESAFCKRIHEYYHMDAQREFLFYRQAQGICG